MVVVLLQTQICTKEIKLFEECKKRHTKRGTYQDLKTKSHDEKYIQEWSWRWKDTILSDTIFGTSAISNHPPRNMDKIRTHLVANSGTKYINNKAILRRKYFCFVHSSTLPLRWAE